MLKKKDHFGGLSQSDFKTYYINYSPQDNVILEKHRNRSM